MRKPRVLVIAEAANPEWVSVPLVGWGLARALRGVADAHIVTHVRNRDALVRAGWQEGREFTAIDSEAVARPMWKLDELIRRLTGLGWTTSTALAALPYYYFEHLVWRRFGDAITRGGYDVVHRVTPLSPTIPSVIARRCRRVGVPFVWGPINGGIPWPPGFEDVIRAEGEWLSYLRDAHRLLPAHGSTRDDAAAIIVASGATLSQVAPHRDKCVYIPENAIDVGRFGEPAGPGLATAAPVLPTGPLRLAFVGRLVPYKGAAMLLEAMAPLARAGAVTLDVIGDGPQRDELVALARQHQLDERSVVFAGWVANDKLAARLGRAEVFAFPSVREFGGGVVLEAMALGLAPVVVDYGGPGELVTPRTGVRIPIGPRPAIVASLRQALANLAADRAQVARLGARARARVRALFTWDAKAAQVAEVYRWVRGGGPKPDFGFPFPELPDDDRETAPGLASA